MDFKPRSFRVESGEQDYVEGPRQYFNISEVEAASSRDTDSDDVAEQPKRPREAESKERPLPAPLATFCAWSTTSQSTASTIEQRRLVMVQGVVHSSTEPESSSSPSVCGCYAIAERHCTPNGTPYVTLAYSLCPRGARNEEFFLACVGAICGAFSVTKTGGELWHCQRDQQAPVTREPTLALHREAIGIQQQADDGTWVTVASYTTRGRNGVYQSRIKDSDRLRLSGPRSEIPSSPVAHPQIALIQMLMEEIASGCLCLMRCELKWGRATNANQLHVSKCSVDEGIPVPPLAALCLQVVPSRTQHLIQSV